MDTNAFASETEPWSVALLPEGGQRLLYRAVGSPDFNERGSVWSLVIVKQISDTDYESAFFYDVARRRNEADELVGIFCRNAVTPCCAGEVLDELLGRL